MDFSKEQIEGIMTMVSHADDRTSAILALSAIEVALENLLRDSFVQSTSESIYKGNGPLATLSSRIEIAFAVGLISEDEKRDLNFMRKIRNQFAHSFDHTITFDSLPIRDWIKELRTPQAFVGKVFLVGDKDTSRIRFDLTFSILFSVIRNNRRLSAIRFATPSELKIKGLPE